MPHCRRPPAPVRLAGQLRKPSEAGKILGKPPTALAWPCGQAAGPFCVGEIFAVVIALGRPRWYARVDSCGDGEY